VCANPRCDFTRDNALPIVAVDEPLYRRLPCFIIATVDKLASLPWLATPLEPTADGQVAVRLGLRMVKGLSRVAAERLVEAQISAPFTDIHDLTRRARLNRKELEALAAADALRSLAGHRHHARWTMLGIETPTPLFIDPRIVEAEPLLRPPTEGPGDRGRLREPRPDPETTPASDRNRDWPGRDARQPPCRR